jgi:PKD repeat protein
MRYRSLVILVVAGLGWVACRDAADPGRLAPDVSSETAVHAEFTFSCVQLACQFTDQSTTDSGLPPVSNWLWSLGDGNTSTEQHPAHVYAAPGSYAVTLQAFRSLSQSDSVTHLVTVSNDTTNLPPHAAFSFSCGGLTCHFFDQSSDSDGVIVRYHWMFGDGGSDTVPNPVHTYSTPGSYDVFHAVVDDDGLVDSLQQMVTVTADSGGGNQPPMASFDFSCSGLTCQFTDQSVDSGGAIVQWTWFFGDGATDSTQNPFHTYGAPGSYTVALFVTDNGGAMDSTSRLVAVGDTGGNNPPIAMFAFSCAALTCQFTDQSVDSGGAIVQWTWLFGDGGTDTTRHPGHTYAATGTYVVSLIVRDDEGASDSTSRLVPVSDTTGGAVLTLAAEGLRVRGVHHASLRWSGATTDSVVVFRDSVPIAAVGDTTYVDNIGQKGHATYVYQVCELGGGGGGGGGNRCSNTATVQFSRPSRTRR